MQYQLWPLDGSKLCPVNSDLDCLGYQNLPTISLCWNYTSMIETASDWQNFPTCHLDFMLLILISYVEVKGGYDFHFVNNKTTSTIKKKYFQKVFIDAYFLDKFRKVHILFKQYVNIAKVDLTVYCRYAEEMSLKGCRRPVNKGLNGFRQMAWMTIKYNHGFSLRNIRLYRFMLLVTHCPLILISIVIRPAPRGPCVCGWLLTFLSSVSYDSE